MEYLTLTAISEKTNNPIFEIAKVASKNECFILLSKMYTVGFDYVCLVHIAGNWSGIAKLESALPTLANQKNFQLLMKRTPLEKSTEQFLPYRVQIFALDSPGLVYVISDFFDEQEVEIERWKTETYFSKNDTPIFSLKMSILIPADANIADLREQFLVFCDELNLDGIFEPEPK